MNMEDTAASAPEDKFRMNAAEHLDAMLGHCARMLEISQDALSGQDGALMLSSAARLITAGATAALAQLRVSLGETRHRAIGETTASETMSGLNANFRMTLAQQKENENEGALEELIRRIDRIAEARGTDKVDDDGSDEDEE